MARGQTQISAYISQDTREMLESYANAHGMKKGHLVEMALLHHLQALRELPADIVIPPRLVVSAEVGMQLAATLDEQPGPTDAMLELFADESG